MNIINVIEERAAEIEVELAESLPVCSQDKEYTFFYSTQTVDEKSFTVNRFFYLYVLDRNSGTVERLPLSDVIPCDLLESASGCLIAPEVLGKDAIDMEDEYRENYAKIIDVSKEGGDGTKLVARNRILLQKLVPESALRQIYYYLGKDFFDIAST